MRVNHLLSFFTVVAACLAAGGTGVSTAGRLPAPPIAGSGVTRVGAQGKNPPPPPQLTPDQAHVLAETFNLLSGKDVIVCRVTPTGSMRPYFDENALLLLEAVPFGELRLGDVITFYHAGLHTDVVHRLLEKRDGVFWAKGDRSQGSDDSYVTPENFRRRLVGVIYMPPEIAPAPTSAAAALPSTTASSRDGHQAQ